MTLVARRVAAEEVKVLAPFNIVDIDALATVDCNGQAGVVMAYLFQVHVDNLLRLAAK